MTTPLRVLHAHSGNIFGGVETVLSTLARWQESAPEVEHAFALCFAGELGDRIEDAGTEWHALGPARVSRPWTVARGRRQLGRVIDALDTHVVVTHSPWSHALFAPVVRQRGRQLVTWMHGRPSGRHWLERWAKRTPPDHILCNSHYTAEASGRLFPRTPTTVVHPPVAPPAPPPPNMRGTVRDAWETPDDAVVVVHASRMEALKGHRLLLAALGKLADVPNWVCWIAGGAQTSAEHDYVNDLRDAATDLGLNDRVRFLGQRSDVSLVLRAADVFCHPNVEPESFGIAFVEALYCGLPVVTTDFGGAAEIVDATCGVRTAPGDVPAVATALRGLINDPNLRHQLGQAGPARAAAVSAPAQQVRRLAQALVADRSPRESAP